MLSSEAYYDMHINAHANLNSAVSVQKQLGPYHS